jgi:hypothetical protein
MRRRTVEIDILRRRAASEMLLASVISIDYGPSWPFIFRALSALASMTAAVTEVVEMPAAETAVAGHLVRPSWGFRS